MDQPPPPPITHQKSLVVEEKSYSELAIERYLQISELQEVIELNEEEYTNVSLQCHLPKQLFGCIFVGHKATDLDSIASAIGAAELFQGVPARASEINNETTHALRIWNIDIPQPYLDVTQSHSSRMTCIVDHNQKVQCPDHLDYDKLIGVIDHHAMQGGTVSTSSPIYVNIHPWGSACTIIATMFFQARRSMSRQTAGILLSGILSDTLNLRSPTTTEYDCLAVSLLSTFAKVSDVNELARSLFKAKSMELLRCTPHQLVRGDLKTFECHCRSPDLNTTTPPPIIKMAFGVIETTDVSGLVKLSDKLIYELRALKTEESKDLVFLALVDIVSLNTQLILVGARELDLATRVFGGQIDQTTGLMQLHNLVSRKKDFIPPLEHYLSKKGWKMPDLSPDEQQSLSSENFGRVELECTEFGCQTVRGDAPIQIDVSCNGQHCEDDGHMGESKDEHQHGGDLNSVKASRHQHRHHHSHHQPRGLTAADVTRRILSSYKLKGPHVPSKSQIDEAITFVLGGTTASVSSNNNGTVSCAISGPRTLPSNQIATKRSISQLEDDSVAIPLTGLDSLPVKRQRTEQPASPLIGSALHAARAPRSPGLLAQNMHIADLDHQQAGELIKELLQFASTDNEIIRNMEETLQLPSKETFKNFIQNCVQSDADPNIKFLLCALAHALSSETALANSLSEGDL
jgi:inorganic pyrophosphatase/exopolyphosphatase